MADDKRTKIGAPGAGRPLSSPAAEPAPPTDPPIPKSATSYLPDQPDPLIGQTLAGRYVIAKKLGEGGMGAVYLATHQVLEKQLALKVLHNEFARKPDLVERFMQEAKAASRIRHENVIDISDFGTTPEGLVFFAMELLHGHDLHEEVARARLAGELLPWQRSKKIFLQICAALSAAHARGIIHRDLKPENVYLVEFLGDPDFVKLLDFGIAKLTEVNEEGRKLTRTGMLFGTPEYMSPEQARGEKVDHRVDVYAMGCILFQLVTGRVPFEAENFMGVLSLHLTEPPPMIPPAVFDRIGAPRELAAVIDRALDKDRAKRWQSIDDLANAVRVASGEPPIDSAARATAGMTLQRPASVPAPAVTKEARTPTPPAGVAVSASESRPRTQWTGNLSIPQESEPPPTKPLPIGKIAGGVAVLGAAGVAVFFATRGSDDRPRTDPNGSSVVVTASADAADKPPPPTIDAPPALPDSVITLDSRPARAEIIDLATSEKQVAPAKFTVPGSHTPRQFLFKLRGYNEMLISVTPDQPQASQTVTLVKGTKVAVAGGSNVPGSGSGSGSGVGPGSGSGSGSSVATKPDVKPDAGVRREDCVDDDPTSPCVKINVKNFTCTSDTDCPSGHPCVDGKCQ